MNEFKDIIVDMDGTLANIDRRLKEAEANPPPGKRMDWDIFLDPVVMAHADQPNWHVIHLVKTLQETDHTIIITSARNERHRAVTSQQLDEWGIKYEKLYLRKDDDFRQDGIVKAELLAQILEDGYVPRIAIDDRQQVVDKWERTWITLLASGEDCSMSKAQLNHNRKIQIRNNKKYSENVFNQKGRYKKITTSATQRGYKVNIKFRKTKDDFTNVIMDKKDRSKFFPVKDDSVGYGTDYTVKDCADRLCFRCNTMLFYEKDIVCRTNEDDSVSLCSGTGKITITEKDELEEWSSISCNSTQHWR